MLIQFNPLTFGNALPVISERAKATPESMIRSVTRQAEKHNAINLGQGTPSGLPPEKLLAVLKNTIIEPTAHQYTNTWGIPSFRKAIAQKYSTQVGRNIDPDKEVTVTCGATEAMKVTIDALVNPGDEVVLFEPFYDNFTPNIIAAGGKPVFIKMKPPHWQFDTQELQKAIGPKTKAIILNSPQNPTGKIFNDAELKQIADLCIKNNLVAITDEIYENITFDNQPHNSIAKLPNMQNRTVVISGLSKSYNATGWRVGYAIAPPKITNAIRSMHDFTTLCVPETFQKAGEAALKSDTNFYTQMKLDYQNKRDFMLDALTKAGFDPIKPEGAYFIMADAKKIMTHLGIKADTALKDYLIEKIGVAVIPGSNFFSHKADGQHLIRVSFCKDMTTLQEAAKRLQKLKSTP